MHSSRVQFWLTSFLCAINQTFMLLLKKKQKKNIQVEALVVSWRWDLQGTNLNSLISLHCAKCIYFIMKSSVSQTWINPCITSDFWMSHCVQFVLLSNSLTANPKHITVYVEVPIATCKLTSSNVLFYFIFFRLLGDPATCPEVSVVSSLHRGTPEVCGGWQL